MPESADYLLSGGTVITVDEERRIIRDGAVAIRETGSPPSERRRN